MLTGSSPTDTVSFVHFDNRALPSTPPGFARTGDRRPAIWGRAGQVSSPAAQLRSRCESEPGGSAVQISPSDLARRNTVAWDGMAAEVVQFTRHAKIACRFRSPMHLLIVCEKGA